jgi:phosphoribosylglycinamide formyltransferase-1
MDDLLTKKKIVVLISGSGSNLQAIIDNCENQHIHAEIVGVISNKSGVFGLERAVKHGILTEVIEHTAFDSRETFDDALIQSIDALCADMVILAGFMRILTPAFTQHYLGKLLNIHPSLLPRYPGLNTHQRAIDAGDNLAGASVHFVTAELDGGPVIIQAEVSIGINDTSDSLASKVLIEEHKLYPKAVEWLCSNRLELKNNIAYLDGISLPSCGKKLS